MNEKLSAKEFVLSVYNEAKSKEYDITDWRIIVLNNQDIIELGRSTCPRYAWKEARYNIKRNQRKNLEK